VWTKCSVSVLVATVALGAGVWLVLTKVLVQSCPPRDRVAAEVRMLQSAVVLYLAEHDDCPDVAKLRAAMILDANHTARDRWMTPLEIRCEAQTSATIPTILSAGPDKGFGTHDDLMTHDGRIWRHAMPAER